MARLTAPNGSTVSVADERVDALLAQGYTKESDAKAPAKKAAAKKSSK